MSFLASLNDILGENLALTQNIENLNATSIILALGSAFICGLIIYLTYRIFYRGVVYSDNFNILLLLVTAVTAFIIMTISSNIVLSLGMVGALSIVRFRAAVKDPLDVGFLFWSVAAGITAGAHLYWVALIGTIVIAVIYIMLVIFKKERKSYLLVVRYQIDIEVSVSGILAGMKYKLKNKVVTDNFTELTIEIKIKKNDTSDINRFKEIKGVQSVTLLEYSGEYMG